MILQKTCHKSTQEETRRDNRKDKRQGKAEFGGGAVEELYVCLGEAQWGFTELCSSLYKKNNESAELKKVPIYQAINVVLISDI